MTWFIKMFDIQLAFCIEPNNYTYNSIQKILTKQTHEKNTAEFLLIRAYTYSPRENGSEIFTMVRR
jgi:hypothetical protein